MVVFLIKRLSVAVLVALTVSLITFSMIYLSGDPAIALAGETASEEEIQTIRRVYGYDRPIIVQYPAWLGNGLQGDLGQSHYLRAPVADVIFERLPTTMLLGAFAPMFALFLSIPLGVVGTVLGVCAGYFGGRFDMVINLIITTRLSMPVVLVALAINLLGDGVRDITAPEGRN